MSTHSYLRAFLAGTFVPTVVLPLLLTAVILVRLDLQAALSIGRSLIFPVAVVPILWGLWNMLYLACHERTHLAVGLHGALLPLLLVPCGTIVAESLGILHLSSNGVTWFEAVHIPHVCIACGFALVLSAYYLLWKYVVGFLNRTLGVLGSSNH